MVRMTGLEPVMPTYLTGFSLKYGNFRGNQTAFYSLASPLKMYSSLYKTVNYRDHMQKNYNQNLLCKKYRKENL